MSSISYANFYQKFGIKKEEHLMLPIMPTIDKFTFPIMSIHHHMVLDSVLNGPESTEYLYRDLVDKKIYMGHIVDLVGDMGSPKKIATPLLPYITEYHKKNRRFKYSLDPVNLVRDNSLLIVVNYGILAKAYRYVRSIYAEYYKWHNLQTTMWKKAAEYGDTSARQQFIQVALPTTLPSLTILNTHSSKFSQTTLTALVGPENWFILEMWKWLSEEYRYNSVIGEMSKEALSKINLVFQEAGRFAVINLGILNSWRYIKDGTADSENQKVKIKPVDLQKQFLKFLMTLMSTRTVTTVDEVITTTADDGTEVETTVQNSSFAYRTEVTDDGEKSAKQIAADMLKNIDSDLEQLDQINKVPLDGAGIPIPELKTKVNQDYSHIYKHVDPATALQQQCDALADNGLLTAAEYRRLLRLSDSYLDIEAPDRSMKLGEYVNIKPEDLKIDEPHRFKDLATVTDKSMLNNTLIKFDEKYVKEVLQRDIASMVVNSQKGGFVVNKYDVERIENLTGAYDMHTVRITPIEGLPSTLRFRIPVIDEDGVYTSGGVRYRMRKQRGDLPLRKTDTDRVAMTTYYGKSFVSRSDKRVNDKGAWLVDKITSIGMDSTNDTISDLTPANMFDNTFETGRTYSSIAKNFKSFKSNGTTYIFDRNSEAFNDDIKAKYNVPGQTVVVGIDSNNNHIVADKNNVLYTVTPNGLEPKGLFETALGIDINSAPVDFAQVKIYGKNIPIGIVLGYIYGVDKLCDIVGVVPRRVNAGQRLNLQDNEFPIQFADETLIFSRDDQLASMIFGGFREYEKVIKNYGVHTFDKPNVYLNILESQGIGPRYIREIDNFNALFVDPISKDLLEQAGHPTSFAGMLIKSSELLLTDAHPDMLDLEHMRIKGYERLAGAVYAEICQAVREHKSRSSRKYSQIEMNPHAVWKRIRQDPSITTSSGINPIKNIKEKEAVTFNGVGGRTSRSMVKRTRAYHPNDMGVISESTVDNGDVGINTFLSANPQFNSVRGTTNRFKIGETGNSSLLSTPAMLSVGATNDDQQ